MVGIRGAESGLTCWHMSAHIGTYQHMSACLNVLTHVCMQYKVQMVGIRGAESGLTCWHMSAHVSTCRHISAHVGMSKCADTCLHAR